MNLGEASYEETTQEQNGCREEAGMASAVPLTLPARRRLIRDVLQKELIEYCQYHQLHVPVICTPELLLSSP